MSGRDIEARANQGSGGERGLKPKIERSRGVFDAGLRGKNMLTVIFMVWAVYVLWLMVALFSEH